MANEWGPNRSSCHVFFFFFPVFRLVLFFASRLASMNSTVALIWPCSVCVFSARSRAILFRRIRRPPVSRRCAGSHEQEELHGSGKSQLASDWFVGRQLGATTGQRRSHPTILERDQLDEMKWRISPVASVVVPSQPSVWTPLQHCGLVHKTWWAVHMKMDLARTECQMQHGRSKISVLVVSFWARLCFIDSLF